jgi:hypothetical protein
LPLERRFLPAFLARFAHTAAMASRACAKESSRLTGGTSSISADSNRPALGTTRDRASRGVREIVAERLGGGDGDGRAAREEGRGAAGATREAAAQSDI